MPKLIDVPSMLVLSIIWEQAYEKFCMAHENV